jgi:hypothetical protein
MMNLKGFCRGRSWRNLKILSQNLPIETEEDHENQIRIAGLRAKI